MFMLATVSVPSNITIHRKLQDTNERMTEVDLIHFADDILDLVATNKFQSCMSEISLNCAAFWILTIVATKDLC